MNKILDIGCGKYKTTGAIGIDIVALPGVDIVHDLNVYPYPFADETFDEMHANMVLEHVDDFMAAMKEIHRLLKVGGCLYVSVPYYSSMNAYSDPTHKNFFTEKTFQYFSKNHELNYYTDIRFEILSIKLRNSNNSALERLRNLIPFKNTFKYLFLNIYDELAVVLKKI